MQDWPKVVEVGGLNTLVCELVLYIYYDAWLTFAVKCIRLAVRHVVRAPLLVFDVPTWIDRLDRGSGQHNLYSEEGPGEPLTLA